MLPRTRKVPLVTAVLLLIIIAASCSALAAVTSAVGGVADPHITVPEPATILLFGGGLIGLAGLVRRRQKR